MTQKRILIADDEDSIRLILSRTIEKMGLQAVGVADGAQALALLTSSAFDAAIVDVRMPSLSGIELLSRRGEFVGEVPIIVMTAQDTMENAVAAMKAGAYDYITKPFDIEEVSLLVERAIETSRLKAELRELRRAQPEERSRYALIGKSRALQEIFKIIGKVADEDVTVLIQGESGTGKELIARALHSAGKREKRPFIAVNCSAIPAGLIESELFGYKKGAFTGADTDKSGYFEQADSGTIFLDEIGELPLTLQVKLLRFLQDKTLQRVGDNTARLLDVRVVAATNRDLKDAVAQGHFREDLYFRLNVVPIQVPPLKQRPEDIAPLVEHFIARYGHALSESKIFSDEAKRYFETLDWPGNVRELENAIKRVLVLSRGRIVTSTEVQAVLNGSSPARALPAEGDILAREVVLLFDSLVRVEPTQLYDRLLPYFEKPLIEEALRHEAGNQVKTAELLGIHRNTLRKKIQSLKIKTEE